MARQLKRPTNVTFDLWTYCLGDKWKSKYIKIGIRNRKNKQLHHRTNKYKLHNKYFNFDKALDAIESINQQRKRLINKKVDELLCDFIRTKP